MATSRCSVCQWLVGRFFFAIFAPTFLLLISFCLIWFPFFCFTVPVERFALFFPFVSVLWPARSAPRSGSPKVAHGACEIIAKCSSACLLDVGSSSPQPLPSPPPLSSPPLLLSSYPLPSRRYDAASIWLKMSARKLISVQKTKKGCLFRMHYWNMLIPRHRVRRDSFRHCSSPSHWLWCLLHSSTATAGLLRQRPKVRRRRRSAPADLPACHAGRRPHPLVRRPTRRLRCLTSFSLDVIVASSDRIFQQTECYPCSFYFALENIFLKSRARSTLIWVDFWRGTVLFIRCHPNFVGKVDCAELFNKCSLTRRNESISVFSIKPRVLRAIWVVPFPHFSVVLTIGLDGVYRSVLSLCPMYAL